MIKRNKRRCRKGKTAIIHGLRAPSIGNIESAMKEDGELISELLHELNCDDVSIFIRLGRRQEGPDAKPRPIKLVAISEGQKDKILSKSKKLEEDKRQKIRASLH